MEAFHKPTRRVALNPKGKPMALPTMVYSKRNQLTIALTLYFMIPLYLAKIVYNFSADGVAAEVGEATGSLIVLILIALIIAGILRFWRIKSIIPFHIAIILSAVVFVDANWNRFKAEFVDMGTYQSEMERATPEDYRDRLAHSQTKLGQDFNKMAQIQEAASVELASAIKALDDEQLVKNLFAATGETLSETLSSLDNRNDAEQRIQAKMALAQTTLPQIGRLFDSVRKIAETKIAETQLATPHPNTDPGKEFLTGFDNARPEKERLIKEYVTNYWYAYKHMLEMLKILDANDGKFTVQKDGKVIFAENEPIAAYNVENAELQRDLANIRLISTKMQASQNAAIQKVIKPE
jgi:hypothetical protein